MCGPGYGSAGQRRSQRDHSRRDATVSNPSNNPRGNYTQMNNLVNWTASARASSRGSGHRERAPRVVPRACVATRQSERLADMGLQPESGTFYAQGQQAGNRFLVPAGQRTTRDQPTTRRPVKQTSPRDSSCGFTPQSSRPPIKRGRRRHSPKAAAWLATTSLAVEARVTSSVAGVPSCAL